MDYLELALLALSLLISFISLVMVIKLLSKNNKKDNTVDIIREDYRKEGTALRQEIGSAVQENVKLDLVAVAFFTEDLTVPTDLLVSSSIAFSFKLFTNII